MVYLVCWVEQYLDWTNVLAPIAEIQSVMAPIAETQSAMARNAKAPNERVQI